MKIEESKEGKLIILSKAFDTRPKVLNFIYFLSFTACGIFFMVMVGPDAYRDWGALLFMVIASGIYLLAGYRFINKAIETEKILITKEHITISRNGLFSFRTNSYPVGSITDLTYLSKPELAPHPLAGKTFDYLGFQTEQAVINEMYGDDRISFLCGGKRVSFGENLYSWDFDELESLIFQITKTDLRRKETFEI